MAGQTLLSWHFTGCHGYLGRLGYKYPFEDVICQEEPVCMMVNLLALKNKFQVFAQIIQHKFISFTTPSNQPALVTGTLSDLPKSKSQLLAQNALLRHQLII